MQKYLLFLLLSISCKIEPDNNQINLTLPGDPKSLDPAKATDVRSGKICALLYDTLVKFDNSINILPAIAKSWNISGNGKKYCSRIRNWMAR